MRLRCKMDIIRVNSYSDPRFSQKVLNQHGCFLINDLPYEVEIISTHEAIIRGQKRHFFLDLIEAFRFYTPHITVFYDENKNIIRTYSPVTLLTIPIRDIQPSQFYVDKEKVAAVSTFLTNPDDVIIQVLRHKDNHISLDGHTRLYYAVQRGWSHVRAVESHSDDYIFGFVHEAKKRGIYSPYNLTAISHEEYELKWNKFCDDFFSQPPKMKPSV